MFIQILPHIHLSNQDSSSSCCDPDLTLLPTKKRKRGIKRRVDKKGPSHINLSRITVVVHISYVKFISPHQRPSPINIPRHVKSQRKQKCNYGQDIPAIQTTPSQIESRK
ncbi:hypothetical protein VTJ04DRAFT_944 [Mycothermus thermophilus]|uniref:uncharacterized protein n=1 Tax=Humicola insolens TaxID=85995 RepID=UPI0037447B09